jgi:DNA-directed RNA polymerase subunit RPC12/RpoP
MPDETTVKFECLHCGQPIEAPVELVGMIIDCPSCGKKVKVVRRLNLPIESLEMKKLAAENRDEERQQLRGTADTFATTSKWILILYCIAAVYIWVTSVANDVQSGHGLMLAGAAAVSLAAWCYLIAQLIYIRVALEKRG